jgi:hypothetical protein
MIDAARNRIDSSRIRTLAAIGIFLGFVQSGCVTSAYRAVPASRLPPALLGESRSATVPLNLALLRQEPPPEHRIGPGDVLGIYAFGMLPEGKPDDPKEPPILPPSSLIRDYYPPNGSLRLPNMGVPVEVQPDGSLLLPLLDPIGVQGATLPEVAASIRKASLDKGLVQMGRDRVLVTLIRKRVHRVLVIREDSMSAVPTMLTKSTVPFTKIGHADVIDLPAYENDVLHALTATGGLPGIDTHNEIWVLRSNNRSPEALETAKLRIDAGEDAAEVFRTLQPQVSATRIPLRHHPDEPLPFGPQDIYLHSGDVIYLEPRTCDYFYVGGLISGGRIPLPRDHDIDVLEAIALANTAIGGPGGAGGQPIIVGAGSGPGNVIPPTRVIILRKLPNGQQLPIRVDLACAMHDKKERIIIQPEDFLMLQYKPGEQFGNVILNIINFSYAIPNN